ncbi:molybdopterin molybdotransferase MoeA [Novosphingobium sp. MBES04]|uniref:molybdopterin molybdotransferase MoeA n=1 Tax=Novosphingobium sp. MBES04 TaxID=1206458 RepID=UPI0007230F38|nr:molybdopterin molybdotransferase MoeA [Novosphingobium sp. MBES04]GAM06547.1 molybdopterin molybdochelatase [Novosphingobium sp. MBES04]
MSTAPSPDTPVMTPPIPLEEAQRRLLALADPMRREHVDMTGAIGRYLAEPLLARRTQPAGHLSAMDGYAVTDGDLAGPWTIVGESAAGHPFTGTMARGDAVRISTGALLPCDAAAVIVQEDLTRSDDALALTGSGPSPQDRHVRRLGSDFVTGKEVLPAGTRIGPAQIALAVSAGHRHLPVFRAPEVAIIDSGDELSSDPENCATHQIPASNGAMLEAMVAGLAVQTRRIGPVGDTLDALLGAFDEAAHADVIVTSGGASVGDHDLIRPALEAWGAKLDFWRIAIKPGKPLLVATRPRSQRRQIIIGLPGNPVSALVTGYHFLLPLLRRLMGAIDPTPMAVTTRLEGDLPATGARREFLRGTWDGECVRAVRVQDSGALGALAGSNVLIDRPANGPETPSGANVRIYILQNGGIA